MAADGGASAPANPLAYKPLSEDVMHLRIVTEKFQQVRGELLAGLNAERARRRLLEQRLSEALQAEAQATRAARAALASARDYALLDRMVSRLRDENKKYKDEIQETRNRASVEADMAAARLAAWERSSKEAQRAAELERQAARDQAREAREAAELERQAARDQAREAREAADKEKRALQEASRKQAEDSRREHEEALAALRGDMKAVRDECAEEVNVAALEFEERSAQLTDRISELESENLSLREQLSASTDHIGYLESRLSELRLAQEAEKNRLMELNRALMLQQQSMVAAATAAPTARAPRGPRGPRARAPAMPPSAPAAAPRFQLASVVYTPASTAAGSYPQLPMWRRGGAPAAPAPTEVPVPPRGHSRHPNVNQNDFSVSEEAAPACASEPHTSTVDTYQCSSPAIPPVKPRRARRRLFEATDIVCPAEPERRMPLPAASSSSALHQGEVSWGTQPPLPSASEVQRATALPPPSVRATLIPDSAPSADSESAAAHATSSTNRFSFKRRIFGSFTSRSESAATTAVLPPPQPSDPPPVAVTSPPESARENHSSISRPQAEDQSLQRGTSASESGSAPPSNGAKDEVAHQEPGLNTDGAPAAPEEQDSARTATVSEAESTACPVTAAPDPTPLPCSDFEANPRTVAEAAPPAPSGSPGSPADGPLVAVPDPIRPTAATTADIPPVANAAATVAKPKSVPSTFLHYLSKMRWALPTAPAPQPAPAPAPRPPPQQQQPAPAPAPADRQSTRQFFHRQQELRTKMQKKLEEFRAPVGKQQEARPEPDTAREVASGQPNMAVTSGQPTEEVTSGQPTEEVTSGQPTKEVTSGQPTEEVTSGQPAEEVTSGQPAKEVTSGQPTEKASEDARLRPPASEPRRQEPELDAEAEAAALSRPAEEDRPPERCPSPILFGDDDNLVTTQRAPPPPRTSQTAALVSSPSIVFSSQDSSVSIWSNLSLGTTLWSTQASGLLSDLSESARPTSCTQRCTQTEGGMDSASGAVMSASALLREGMASGAPAPGPAAAASAATGEVTQRPTVTAAAELNTGGSDTQTEPAAEREPAPLGNAPDDDVVTAAGREEVPRLSAAALAEPPETLSAIVTSSESPDGEVVAVGASATGTEAPPEATARQAAALHPNPAIVRTLPAVLSGTVDSSPVAVGLIPDPGELASAMTCCPADVVTAAILSPETLVRHNLLEPILASPPASVVVRWLNTAKAPTQQQPAADEDLQEGHAIAPASCDYEHGPHEEDRAVDGALEGTHDNDGSISYSPLSELTDDPEETTRSPKASPGADESAAQPDAEEEDGVLVQLVDVTGLALLQESYTIGCSQAGGGGGSRTVRSPPKVQTASSGGGASGCLKRPASTPPSGDTASTAPALGPAWPLTPKRPSQKSAMKRRRLLWVKDDLS